MSFQLPSTDNGNNQQDGQQNIYQTSNESFDTYIYFSFIHQTPDEFVEQRDEETSDNKDKDRNQYTFSGTNTEVYQLLSNQRKLIQSVSIGNRLFH